MIGIDANQASGLGPQTLSLFQVLIDGIEVLADRFTGSTGNIPTVNNGQGFADYVLTGFTALQAGHTITFRIVLDDLNDGPDNVFLIAGPNQTQVPEPATWTLMGLGLLALGMARRFRRAA